MKYILFKILTLLFRMFDSHEKEVAGEDDVKVDLSGDIQHVDFSPGQQVRAGVKSKIQRKTLIKCLESQKILRTCGRRLLEDLADNGETLEFASGDVVTQQGDLGDGAFFILTGSVDVLVNQKHIATRGAKECVGEMSMLDPTQKRSATLVASEFSRLMKIDENSFGKLLKEQHVLKNIAVELSERLRERAKVVTRPNEKPSIFIGSSSEYLSVVQKLGKELRRNNEYDVKTWDEGVFSLSKSNLESLCDMAMHADFGVFLLSSDDFVTSRDVTTRAPRDNVLFELGLFMGQLGRERTFIIRCGNDIKMPTDIDGIVFLSLEMINGKTKKIIACANALKQEIERKGVR